jgi:hypothetical protein
MSPTTLTPERIPTGTYNVDPAHSNVGFEVKHMGIATVRGTFRKFSGTVEADGHSLALNGTVETASIDTARPSSSTPSAIPRSRFTPPARRRPRTAAWSSPARSRSRA